MAETYARAPLASCVHAKGTFRAEERDGAPRHLRAAPSILSRRSSFITARFLPDENLVTLRIGRGDAYLTKDECAGSLPSRSEIILINCNCGVLRHKVAVLSGSVYPVQFVPEQFSKEFAKKDAGLVKTRKINK